MRHLRSIHKRILIFFIFLAILVSPMFAGGIGEARAGAFMTVAGIAVGAIAGWTGIGAVAAGAMIGGGVGMIGGGVGDMLEEDRIEIEEQNQYTAAYQTASGNYTTQQTLANSLQANISSLETDILQTEANISSFDQALVRWQSQYDQQRRSLQLETEGTYRQLLQNWQGVELVNATRGQSGGSASLVAQSQMAQVERLAGSDLKLDQYGGIYGDALHEFNLDMLAGRNELVGNMRIQQEALKKQQSALSSYRSQLASVQANIRDAQAAMDAARENAINNGVDPVYVGGSK